MLSRINFCVNSQTPHASKNKRDKPYFFTHEVMVAPSSSKILTDGKLRWSLGHQDDNKNTYEANVLWSMTFKENKNTHFFRIKHLRPPSPKRLVAETAVPNCPRPWCGGVPWASCSTWCATPVCDVIMVCMISQMLRSVAAVVTITLNVRWWSWAPGLWSRKSRHPTFNCISYLKW